MLGQVQFCSWWRTEESSSTIVIRILQVSTMMNPEPVNSTKESHRVLLLKLLQIKKKIGNSKLGLRLTMLNLKQEELCQAEQLLLDSSSCQTSDPPYQYHLGSYRGTSKLTKSESILISVHRITQKDFLRTKIQNHHPHSHEKSTNSGNCNNDGTSA